MTKEDFKYCFDTYFDPVRNYLYYRGGNSDLASDIAQDTFMKLWEKEFEFHPVKTKSLIYKIANELFITECRKLKNIVQHAAQFEFEWNHNTPEKVLQFQETKKQYESILAQLPEKNRTVFLMHRIEELSYKEIAERLNVSVKAIEKRMSKTLQEIRKKLN